MNTKITYLLLLLPFLTFAQGPWEFNTSGSVEGFVAGSAGELSTAVSAASTLTQVGTDLKVDFATGQTKSPIISNPNAAINADNMNFIEIRLKNLGTATYLRVGPNTGANYVNVVISKNDTDYKTYVVDVTAWSGPAVGISLFFKLNDGGTSGANYKPTVVENMLIDYIKPLASVVTPQINTFNFDTTTDYFTVLTRATAVQASDSSRGTLKINCTTAASTNAKVALSSLLAHVEGANKYAHITLKNTSTNTLFQLNGKIAGVVTAFNPIQTYTISDADYKTYDFDLSTWDNGYQFPELNFAVKNTWLATSTYAIDDIVISGNTYCKNKTGINSTGLGTPANVPHTDTANWDIVNASGAVADASPATNGAVVGAALDIALNSVYIDSIVFDNTLSTADFGSANNTISLFPNPANDVLNISSSNSITKIEVYDLQGRNVASNNNASNVNVAALGKGAYFVKVVQENGSVIAKQFIKK